MLEEGEVRKDSEVSLTEMDEDGYNIPYFRNPNQSH
jgi:hypothetical protein